MLFPRRLTLALLCAPAIGLAVPHAAAAQSAPSLSLEETVALATTHAGDAESSRGAVEAAVQMAVAAGQLPDPVLKLGLNNVPVNGPDQFSLSRDFMTMRSISVMQEFTRSAKRRAKVARFEAEATAAEAQRGVGLANVQRNAVGAWLDRWYAEQAGVLLSHHGHPLELALQAATAAYRSGRGTRADVLAAELEVQKLHDRQDENRIAAATAALNLERWVGPAARRPLSERPRLDVSQQVKQLAQGQFDAVPELAAAQREVARAEAEIRAAIETKRPDVTVELMYSQRGSAYSNMGSVNVSFPVPWDQPNRQDREVAAKLAQAQEARAKSEIIRRNTQTMVGARLAELQRNRDRLQRYDEKTLPLATIQAEAALTAYRANTGSLLAVAEANHRVIDTKLERLALEAKTAKLWADLTFLVPLPTAQTEPAIKEFQ
ncbi:TolC family protein [Cupriavidus oxalaticus]|uniref:Cobalt-zinc-cadmium resistance outer membrane porin n=1 Tax=Cupriavidus oxalaticus TaxID=96344 RepID=A0A375FME3_9BURK|nr:TolC family protein [Cupriavidus oxalaticus]QRQ85906.1 TolC family protein [Cupriavidus oxalaticus]QRQ95768.1 TolC family protein [Cupriavidus oxalaticus]WQD84433.1 TolC family protein [Cupriavidus oxalaticus]SPC06666.1 Cobalt-zinc-cadmium resistance outer membrane porin [Cupriavidus oxalaticus]SPC12349.1 Cobalt-zinc-cadmium resistance outer membrane porin [Cupriavidus oxalaticus]